MNRAILLLLIGALIGGGAVWMKERHSTAKPSAETAPSEKPAPEEEAKTTISHDANGNVVIGMSDEAQGDAGILVDNPKPAQSNPEVKGYGRLLDPAPLAALVTELATTQAAYVASSNELARQKMLTAQGNASPRVLQTAEATALHDQLAAQSARDRLILAWGKTLAESNDLSGFLQSLTSQDAALVRVDLPPSEMLKSQPIGARIVLLSGDSAPAEFLGLATAVDAQVQGQGFIFLIKPNTLRLQPGQGVTGYLRLPGEPIPGVIIPRNAVVRAEGKGWIYLLNQGGESLTRKEIPLDHPTENGWFVTDGATAGDHVVVTGAQMLLSEELKATIKPD